MTNRACAALIAALRAPAALPIPATLVVLAHPDDETVGAGSRLSRLQRARFIYVTDGSPRNGRDAARQGLSAASYARLRRHELETVLAQSGIAGHQIFNFGCPDQEAATILAKLARRFAKLFTLGRAEAVLTHPYEGGHPDHDATAFGVHAAAAWLHGRGALPPCIVEMSSYHQGAEGLRPGSFLPAADIPVTTVALTPEEQQRKRELFACFASQRETLQYFPLAAESFRVAPAYDFTQPPHAGPLFYEGQPWGMTGAQFRLNAAQAMAELELEGML
jgi:LmbE family N-acetylglucosaminyl deacetylase